MLELPEELPVWAPREPEPREPPVWEQPEQRVPELPEPREPPVSGVRREQALRGRQGRRD